MTIHLLQGNWRLSLIIKFYKGTPHLLNIPHFRVTWKLRKQLLKFSPFQITRKIFNKKNFIGGLILCLLRFFLQHQLSILMEVLPLSKMFRFPIIFSDYLFSLGRFIIFFIFKNNVCILFGPLNFDRFLKQI